MIRPILARRRAQNHSVVLRKAVLAILALALALVSVGSMRTRDNRVLTTFAGNTSSSFAVPALGFAVADFTGDTHPDLATARLNGVDSRIARYSIEVRLSEGGGQSLRVTAPFGGLVITPKDLTGDGNLDLVVRSARSRAPVAVFLNDGRGHFSAAAPSSFVEALREAPHELAPAADQAYFSPTVVSSEPNTLLSQVASARDLRLQDGVLLPESFGAPSRLSLPFGSNRAPPAAA